MARTALSAAFLILAAVAASGCVSKALLEFADKIEVRDNIVTGVTVARRDEAGDIFVCATGLPAERDRTRSPVEYGVKFPLSLFDDGEAGTPLLAGSGADIRRYTLTPEDIADDCPTEIGDPATLPVTLVEPKYLSSVALNTVSDEALRSFIDEAREGAALYVFQSTDPGESALLVYQHDSAVFEGNRLVGIELPAEPVKPNENAVIALPLAFAADVVIVAAVVVLAAAGILLGAFASAA